MIPPTRRLPSRPLPWPRLRSALVRLALVAVVVGAAGCAPPAEPTPRGDAARAAAAVPAPAGTAPAGRIADREGIRAALEDLAAAFASSDPAAVRRSLADPDSPFGRRWRARAGNLSGVPLATYELRLDTALPDLATDRVRRRHDNPVQVVAVSERVALEGLDPAGPASHDLFLTMIERDGRWLVAGDADAEPLGLVSADHLWDHGPVTVTRSGPVAALHHPGAPAVGTVLAETRAALRRAGARWPLSWAGRVAVVLPRDAAELRALLQVTFDTSGFVAFATATRTGERGAYRLTGSRIVLNPEIFPRRAPATRRRILVHELTHVATRPVAGPHVPAWLDEGVAQAVGEQRPTADVPVPRLRLPPDPAFVVGDRQRILRSYRLAHGFVAHLLERHGTGTVARFYAAAGRGAVGEPGTDDWHLDRAAREVLGAGLDELVEEWRAAR